MAGVNKYTAEEVIKALQDSQGLPALAADKLGCTAQTIYNYRERYKSVAEAMHHQKEKRIDFAEGKLWQNINTNDTTAIIFFLKTQGKARGYVERQEVTGADGKQLEIIVRRGQNIHRPDDVTPGTTESNVGGETV